MDLHDTIRTYRLFSGSYDIVFGPVFHPGRKEAVRIANDRPGQRILEVGVGTGLSLPHFRPDSRVTGIDVSEDMLAKARRRAERLRLAHVEGLHVMDAETSTDSPSMRCWRSTSPRSSPTRRFAAEMRRVCIPAGRSSWSITSPAKTAGALHGKAPGPGRPSYRLSCRFPVGCVPPRQPAVDPGGAAKQPLRLLETVALRQRKARFQPALTTAGGSSPPDTSLARVSRRSSTAPRRPPGGLGARPLR